MKKISDILPEQLPEFIRADHPNFIAFLEAYYEYLEQEGKAVYTGRNDWGDIDDTLPEFLDFFYKDYLPLFPENILGDKTLLAKNAKVFYRSKGTEKSFKLLFRSLFNEDVDIYYPKKDILQASGGKWIVSVSLRMSPTDPSLFPLLKNLQINGRVSGATALVDNTRIYSAFGITIYEAFVSNAVGDFLSTEEIYATYSDDLGNITEITGRTLGILSNIRIIHPGANNNLGDLIPITGGGGVGAAAFVSEVTTGRVVDVEIHNPGAGFLVGDIVTFTTAPGDNGAMAAAYVQAIESFDKQHPDSFYLNSDIVGGYSNVTLNTVSFSTNVSGRVNVAGSSNVVFGNGTIFLSELGPNVGLTISGNTRSVTNVVNNNYLTVNSAYSTVTQTGMNGVITTSFTAANVNSIIFDAFDWNIRYGPTGPVRKVRITNKGANYKLAPTANIAGYIPIRNLGIIGALKIVNAGTGYAVGDEILFTTVDGFGRGGAAFVTEVEANGAISGIDLAYPKLPGWGNVASNSSNVIRGTGTAFTTDLVVGDVLHILSQERAVINIANNTWLTVNTPFSFNGLQANVRIGIKREFIGGVQYNTSVYHPTINVSSVSGSNANIAIASFMAEGEKMHAITVAGEIVEVTITNPGVGYVSNVTIDMTNNGDGEAILEGDIVVGAYKYPGRYESDTNLLNSASKLQDRDYYQNFSYVLKSKLSFNKYVQALKALVHPIGMKVFSETLVESDHNFANTPSFSISSTHTMQDATLAWRDAVYANSGTVSSSRMYLMNDFIGELMNGGFWDRIDDLWVFAGENSIQSLVSVKQKRLSTIVNSPTFTKNRGFTFNGTTNYLNTLFVPTSHVTVSIPTSVHFGIYENGVELNSNSYAAGAHTSSSRRILVRTRYASSMSVSLNHSAAWSATLSPLSSLGFTYSSRHDTGATTELKQYKNGVLLATQAPIYQVSGTSHALQVSGYNNIGVPTGFRAGRYGLMVYGATLTGVNPVAYNSIVQNYMTLLGANA